ncbi:unnamed protein product [Rhodiola kirilowii]
MSNAAASAPHVVVLAFPYGTHAAQLIAIIRHLAHLDLSGHSLLLPQHGSLQRRSILRQNTCKPHPPRRLGAAG